MAVIRNLKMRKTGYQLITKTTTKITFLMTDLGLFPFRPANKDYKTRDSSSSVAVFVFYGQHITLLGEFKIPILVVRNVMNHAPTLAHGD